MGRYRGVSLGARFKGVKHQGTAARVYKGVVRATPRIGKNPKGIRHILKALGVRF